MRSQVPASWRQWATPIPVASSATSAPLGSHAAVRNRLFPKTRSWFALDAPLALLSPLSVLRMMFALATVSWSIAAALWPADRPPDLGRRPQRPPRSSHGSPSSRCAGSAWCGAWRLLGRLDRAGLGPALGEPGDRVADRGRRLLRAGRRLRRAVLPLPACRVLSRRRSRCASGPPASGPWASARAAFVAARGHRSACRQRRSPSPSSTSRSAALGTVDPETGTPNGLGMVRRLDERDQAIPMLVVCSLVRGIDSAREALGYQAGTELLRRAVEDVGQVLPANATIGRTEADELVVVEASPAACRTDRRSRSRARPRRRRRDWPRRSSGRSSGRTLRRRRRRGRAAHPRRDLDRPWDGADSRELLRRASLSAKTGAGRRSRLGDLAGRRPHPDRRRPRDAGRPGHGRRTRRTRRRVPAPDRLARPARVVGAEALAPMAQPDPRITFRRACSSRSPSGSGSSTV